MSAYAELSRLRDTHKYSELFVCERLQDRDVQYDFETFAQSVIQNYDGPYRLRVVTNRLAPTRARLYLFHDSDALHEAVRDYKGSRGILRPADVIRLGENNGPTC